MIKKIANKLKGFFGSERVQMFCMMMIVGSVAMFAQNSAGNYEAGTTALTTVTEEIAKYVPIVVKLYQDEQRGAGCQEVDHDDCRRLHLPRGRSPGSASFLRRVTRGEYRRRKLSVLSHVQGASTAS